MGNTQFLARALPLGGIRRFPSVGYVPSCCIAEEEGSVAHLRQIMLEELRASFKRAVGSVQNGFPYTDKVNSLCPNPQLLIALHSPNALLKPDCVCALRRKRATVTPSPTSSAFSVVRFACQ